MAYGTYDVLELMSACAKTRFERLRVDGGATENGWLLQFQADVLGVPVERPDVIETTALGAAGLAGVAAGVWPTPESFIASRAFTTFRPGPGRSRAREGLAGWNRAVRAALTWARDAS
jgi:glycerol kinase